MAIFKGREHLMLQEESKLSRDNKTHKQLYLPLRLRGEKWVQIFVVLDENKLLFYRDHKSKELVSVVL